jgi:hypothetical protein
MAGTDVNPFVAGFGALAAIVAGWFGYLGNVRGRKAADSVLIMGQMREFAKDVQDSERECREEQDKLRRAFDKADREHRAELHQLRSEHREQMNRVLGELEQVRRRLAELES